MFDLAISEHGDLIFAANRDLLGVDGTTLIEQRIRTRLKIPRGSWVYDVDQSLGSRIHIVLNHDVERAHSEIPMFVKEALDEMEDVSIGEVQLISDDAGRQVSVYVGYSIETLPDGAGEPSTPNEDELILSLPL